MYKLVMREGMNGLDSEKWL